MAKLLGFLGSTVGGWAGWTAGSHLGPMTGFIMSVVGTAAGIYLARRAVRSYF